jgi:tyrosyl-tRNA synthetase
MVGQKPQQVFMVPLLVGTDGALKMSKSVGNYIGIAESPENIYGKVMSIPDGLIMQYFELLTDVPDKELKELKNQLAGGANPMTLKKRLAREIVAQFHGDTRAEEAEGHFEKTVQKKELPDEMEEYPTDGKTAILVILAQSGLAASNSEVVRMLKQGAITVDGRKISKASEIVPKGAIIKFGKRRYLKTV